MSAPFWEARTLESVYDSSLLPPYRFSPVCKLKNGFSVVNTASRTREAFITKYFGHFAMGDNRDELARVLDVHVRQQRALQPSHNNNNNNTEEEGLLYFDFRVWFDPIGRALNKLQQYKARMAAVDAKLRQEFDDDVLLLSPQDCAEGTFVSQEFQVFLNPKAEKPIGTVQQVARSVAAQRLLNRCFPCPNKPSMFAVAWNSFDRPLRSIATARDARRSLVAWLDAIPLVERGLRVAGPTIAGFLDLGSQKRVAVAFAGMYDIVFAFSIQAVEADLIAKLRLDGGGRAALLDVVVNKCGLSAPLLKLLLNRAAECPERMQTVGTDAVKKEIQARLMFSARDHLVIEYCCTMMGGDEFRQKKFAQLQAMEPELVTQYVTNGFVGTGEELIVCLHLRQILKRVAHDDVDVVFTKLRRQMLDAAKTSNKSWEMIGKEVMKRHLGEMKARQRN